MGTIRVLGAVKGNDFMANDVVAGLQRGGDSDVPREAVADQLIGGPGTRVGARDQTRLVNLDPLQGGLVDGGGVISSGNVGDDGTVVRVGPGFPGGRDGTTSRNSSIVQQTVGGILVADDVGCAKSIWSDVAVVRGRSRPRNELITRVRTGSHRPLLVETGEGVSANGPAGDVTVSPDEAGAGGQSENGRSLGRHVERRVDVKSTLGLNSSSRAVERGITDLRKE